VSTPACCHGRDGERLENPSSSAALITASDPNLLSAPLPWRCGINIGDLSPLLLASGAARARNYLPADRPRRPPGWQCPAVAPSSPAPPTTSTSSREPEAIAARPRSSAHRAAISMLPPFLRRQLLAFTLIAGAERHRLPRPCLASSYRPRCGREGWATQDFQTLSLTTLAAVVPAHQGRIVLERFLSSSRPAADFPPNRKLQRHSFAPRKAP